MAQEALDAINRRDRAAWMALVDPETECDRRHRRSRTSTGGRVQDGAELRPADPERKVVVDEQEDEEDDDQEGHDHHGDHQLQGGVSSP